MLGSSEDNTALSRALSQLAEVEEKIEQLHQEQANNDFFLLAELLSDYIRLLAIVRVSPTSSPPAIFSSLAHFSLGVVVSLLLKGPCRPSNPLKLASYL